MYSDKELQISNKSYINKSFDTIYPELIQTGNSLTNRIDFNSTNESDPLIVLTKLLAFIGDKNSYNGDKGVLETRLPSATQETSFRSIAEANGYNMRYYLSATTTVSVTYNGDLGSEETIVLEPFKTQFSDSEGKVIYTLISGKTITGDTTSNITLDSTNKIGSGQIIQGTYEDLLVNNSTNIQLSNLDGNNRIYFPTTMVAQNGIFVKNSLTTDWVSSDEWEQVYNLNLYAPGSKKFKFGFDSNKGLPYIQFPDDIIDLIDSGLNVRYIITSGVNGNVPRGYINTILKSSLNELGDIETEDENGNSYFRILNIAASANGYDPEDLDEAYFHYKRQVGTFNNLITPRDFSNYLFEYVDSTNSPFVSNVQVSDRRTDINFAFPIMSWNDLGNHYTYKYVQYGLGSTITPFDLVLYPLEYVSTIIDDDTYNQTFTKSSKIELIPYIYKDTQSIDHTYIDPSELDSCRYLYKNYYTLNARISTTKKVNDVERSTIIYSIKQALYQAFNSRKVEYGKEIPYDELLTTIQNSNSLIKNVILDEPVVTTKVLTNNGEVDFNGSEYYNAVARNVLAGKISLFEYDNDFTYKYGQDINYKYDNISKIETSVSIPTSDLSSGYVLQPNEVVQFYSPNYSTYNTAVIGVNYLWVGNNLNKNITHKIVNNEKLYISYTNSNDEVRTLEYNSSAIITYNESGIEIGRENVSENIIKPNFNLTNTTGDVVVNIPNVEIYCKTLDTSEEIAFLKKVEITLDHTNFGGLYKMYWSMENVNNDLFPNSAVGGVKTTMLSENEYLIYTNSEMNQIEVFGAGTILTTNMINNDWTIPSDSLISLDTINTSDISTYGNLNWKDVYFKNNELLGNDYINATQTNILTLTDGDTLKGTFANALSITPVQAPNNVEYKYETSTEYESLPTLETGDNWMVYARLDINCGPDNPQKINDNDTITLTYLENNVETTNGVASDFLMLSQLIQVSGATPLLVNTSQIQLKAIEYNINTSTYTYNSETKDIILDKDYSIAFNLENLQTDEVKFDLYVPMIEDEDTYIMFYNNVIGELGTDYSVTIIEVDENLNTSTCQQGVNVLKIEHTLDGGGNETGQTHVELTITSENGNNLTGSIYLSPVKISQGFNSVFKLQDGTGLMNEIDTILGNDNPFNYITSVENVSAIDVEDFTDASTLWSVNNVLNKFTLPQIDFETSYIDILKSSRM